MKNLFIDANIWLSLYDFSGDDLEQFSQLKEIIGEEINLLIPEQTRNEVQRNRDNKIRATLKEFRKFNFCFPTFCKCYDEYLSFYKDYNSLKQRHEEWCNKIDNDISNQALQADKVIRELFDICHVIECNDEIIRNAELRFKSGNPPGKDNRLGDAINWECLLSVVPNGEDIYLVSGDKDYQSVFDKQSFNSFLKGEWESKKQSSVFFFPTLVMFFKAHVKEIELKNEKENEQFKEHLINCLESSPNFKTTHEIIESMCKYQDWTDSQIDCICAAAILNTQVDWILDDYDVSHFFNKLLSTIDDVSENIAFVRAKLESIKTKQ